jgi:hypothetical protein
MWSPSGIQRHRVENRKLVRFSQQQLHSAIVIHAQALSLGTLSGEGKEQREIVAAAVDRIERDNLFQRSGICSGCTP